MKISVLTPDLSHNCLGRAYLLAKILQRHYDVEIVGPILGEGIWKPVADDKTIEYKSVKVGRGFKPYWQIRELAKKIDGDVIYASKPLFTSFGVGLLEKIFKKKPLILDIDDWQMGFMKENYESLSATRRFRHLASSALCLYNPGSYWNNLFGENLSHLADEITVSNNFLKEKFGGTIIWHGRDAESFNPEKFNKILLKVKYEVDENKKIVMFFGTPRPHKGVDDLIKAISLIEDPDVILVIVGIDYKDSYCLNLVETAKRRLGEERFIDFGIQPFEKIPEFLSMGDVVVIPQRENFATLGQMPAKVFDAMAMAKPTIATNVSDLPLILDNCGWITKPGDLEQLADTIKYVLKNPEEAEEIGQKARQKFIKEYSWDALEKILIGIFKRYE